MRAFASRFLRDEGGATAIEYALIISLVAALLVASLTTIGTKLSGTFNNVAAVLK